MIRQSVFVILACLIVTMALVPVTAFAAEVIPQTPDGIHELAEEILKDEILQYCSAVYLREDIRHLSADELSTAVNHFPEYPRRITDTKNTTTTIVKPLNRIVAYNFHAITALDAEDRVIGVANSAMQDSCVVPVILTKVNIGGGGPYEPDFETILACQPDVLLTYSELGPGPEFFEKRMPPGVPVIRLDFIRPGFLVSDMKKLGYLLNCTDRSVAYEQWHDHYMDEIDHRLVNIPEKDRVRVFVDIWSTTYTGRSNERRTVSGGQWYSYGRYCTDGGGINVAEDLNNPQSTVDIEWIAQQNPDVILGVAYDGSYDSDDMMELQTQYDELISHPALQDVSAIRNKRIYILSYRYTNGLTYPAARARVSKWFYPELFSDMDPAAIHQEYVSTFLNSPFDVTQHGVFSYPG